MSAALHATLVRSVAPFVVVPAILVPVIGSVPFTSQAGAENALSVAGALAPRGDLVRPATTVQSENQSGYAVSGATSTHVATTVVVPEVTCTSTQSAAELWVGLNGSATKAVEQTGVFEGCFSGSAAYGAWSETAPNAPVFWPETVAPGDVVTESVKATSPTTYALSISDATQGWSRTTTQTVGKAKAKRTSAEVMVEAPPSDSVPAPLANFGTATFTNAKVDGTAIGKLHPVTVVMVNGSTHDDSVSALTKNKDFTVTWLNSGAS